VRHRLGLATRTQISVCKSPFPSAGTAVSLFRAKTVQQKPLLPREVETRLLDCVVAHKLMTLYMAEILPAKFYQILTMLRRQQVLYWTGTEPLGLINTIGYQKREIIRWLSVNRQCNNTINSFYFMIFYQSIRHAILLSIVLTLLSSVL